MATRQDKGIPLKVSNEVGVGEAREGLRPWSKPGFDRVPLTEALSAIVTGTQDGGIYS